MRKAGPRGGHNLQRETGAVICCWRKTAWSCQARGSGCERVASISSLAGSCGRHSPCGTGPILHPVAIRFSVGRPLLRGGTRERPDCGPLHHGIQDMGKGRSKLRVGLSSSRVRATKVMSLAPCTKVTLSGSSGGKTCCSVRLRLKLKAVAVETFGADSRENRGYAATPHR